jgi:hypothetical protein
MRKSAFTRNFWAFPSEEKMNRTTRLLLVLCLALATRPAAADDKDLLRPTGLSVPANLYIVFGNSQTTTQTLSALTGSPMSTWDGDADSPSSKLGASKIVLRQFITDFSPKYNIGMTAFSRPPNVGTTINRKHWVYQSLDTDFPNDSFREPVGTLERLGPRGEGPCTSKTVPACTAVSTNYINFVAPYQGAFVASNSFFFGPTGTDPAYINLDGTVDSQGRARNSTKRIKHTIVTGKYGDAFTDGTLTNLTLGTYSVAVQKVYQTCGGGCDNDSGNWVTRANTPGGSPGTVTVHYRPPTTMPALWFYPTGATNINGASISTRTRTARVWSSRTRVTR